MYRRKRSVVDLQNILPVNDALFKSIPRYEAHQLPGYPPIERCLVVSNEQLLPIRFINRLDIESGTRSMFSSSVAIYPWFVAV